MPDHVDPAPSMKETADNADNSASSATNSPFSTMEEALGPQEGGDGGIRRSRRVPVTVLWAVAVVVIVVDQITKQWALAALADGRHTALLGRALGLVLVRNPGAAFSFATGQTWIFALIAFLVVIIIIRVSRNLVSRSWAVALGLVLGGAVGNLIDRLLREPGFLRGHVIDFIDYGGYCDRARCRGNHHPVPGRLGDRRHARRIPAKSLGVSAVQQVGGIGSHVGQHWEAPA